MKEEESTHTHHTNEILLGACVSDHPQNFATKEANLSPTHWQTPEFFSFFDLLAVARHQSPGTTESYNFKFSVAAVSSKSPL
jgi:hypothetical protein